METLSLKVKNSIDSHQKMVGVLAPVGNQQPSSFRNGGEGSETIESILSNNNFMDEISYMKKSELSPSGSMCLAPYYQDVSKGEDIVQTVEKFTDCFEEQHTKYGGIWLAASKRKDFLVQSLPSTFNTLGGMKMNTCLYVECNNEIPEGRKYCSFRCQGKQRHLNNPKFFKELSDLGSSKGGYAVHKKHPDHIHKNREKIKKNNPNFFKEIGSISGKIVQEKYPDLAANNARKAHANNPEMARENAIKMNNTMNSRKVDGLHPVELLLWSNTEFQKLSPKKNVTIPDKSPNNGYYIVDFLIGDLVVELDGVYHNKSSVKEADTIRECFLMSCGYQVIRFRNEEVIANIDIVVHKIKQALE